MSDPTPPSTPTGLRRAAKHYRKVLKNGETIALRLEEMADQMEKGEPDNLAGEPSVSACNCGEFKGFCPVHDGYSKMPRNFATSEPPATSPANYVAVCICKWTDDKFTAICGVNPRCTIHGTKPPATPTTISEGVKRMTLSGVAVPFEPPYSFPRTSSSAAPSEAAPPKEPWICSACNHEEHTGSVCPKCPCAKGTYGAAAPPTLNLSGFQRGMMEELTGKTAPPAAPQDDPIEQASDYEPAIKELGLRVPADDPIEKMLRNHERLIRKGASFEAGEEWHDEIATSRQAIRDYVSRLRAERDEAREKYGLLSDAINENPQECDEKCDSYGHEETCKHTYHLASSIIEDQQKKLSKMKETALTPEEVSMITHEHPSHWYHRLCLRYGRRDCPECAAITSKLMRAAASPTTTERKDG